MSTTAKELRFPVAVRWRGGRLTSAQVAGKPALEVATPPEFGGGVAGVWSPEDLVVAATASCFVLTLVAVAARRALPLIDVDVAATGHVGRRDDGRFGFTGVDLDARVETTADCVEAAEEAAEAAERGCIVAVTLEIPVRLHVEVAAAAEAAASSA